MLLAFADHSLDQTLLELSLLFALCIAVVVGFHRLRVPPIAGFLIAGALLGPKSFGMVQGEELVIQLAEIGVVVLLFTVGMELSLRDLFKLRRTLLLGGGLQIGLTLSLGAVGALVAGLPWGVAIFLGIVLTLSSTAAIAKLLQDRGELGSPTGRLAMSICVAQDLAVVPMILAIPLLAGGGAADGDSPIWGVAKSFFYLSCMMVAAWFVVPRALDLVSRTRSREVFVLSIFTLCLAASVLTAEMGLSLALGAFLVGLIVSESGFHHQAAAEVEPFRDALSSLFFVSIGMLFDYRIILEQPLFVLVALVIVVVGKATVIMLAAKALGLPRWVGIRGGLLMAQVGEFSFVIIQVAKGQELGLAGIEQVFYVVAVLSIALTPLLMMIGRRLTQDAARTGEVREKENKDKRRDHVIIVGFGPAGQFLANALRDQFINFIAIEMNSSTVKRFKERDYPIFLGDSSREAVLHAAGIHHARILVLAVNDPEATKKTADLAKRLNPHVRIVARANYIGEAPELMRLGVHEVVPQELETAVEIMVRTLQHYLVPSDAVGREVARVRRSVAVDQRALRPHENDLQTLADHIPGLGVEVCKVEKGAAVAGFSLQDTDLRRTSGCTVVAIKRGTQTELVIRPDSMLEEGDVVVMIGPRSRVGEAVYLFQAPSPTTLAPDQEVDLDVVDVPADEGPEGPATEQLPDAVEDAQDDEACDSSRTGAE